MQEGGGLRTLEDMRAVLLAGAEKISIDSGAVRDPDLVRQGSEAFGAQCVVLSMQVLRVAASREIPSGCEIHIDGGRTPTGLDAVEWSMRGEALGAGELVVNSIDADGTTAGYDVELTREIARRVSIPVIASGGAGSAADVARVLDEGEADAAIIASIIHKGDTTIGALKRDLARMGIPVRRTAGSEG